LILVPATQTRFFRAGIAAFSVLSLSLFFDVLSDDLKGCAATADSEVAGAPEMATPELALDLRVILCTKHSTAHTFEAVDQARYSHGGGVFNQQVNMIIFSIEFYQLRSKIVAHPQASLMYDFNCPIREHSTPIFGDKDQVNVEQADNRPATSVFSSFPVACHS
jgi:hypothetical protein